jgi:hypothetical protein
LKRFFEKNLRDSISFTHFEYTLSFIFLPLCHIIGVAYLAFVFIFSAFVGLHNADVFLTLATASTRRITAAKEKSSSYNADAFLTLATASTRRIAAAKEKSSSYNADAFLTLATASTRRITAAKEKI